MNMKKEKKTINSRKKRSEYKIDNSDDADLSDEYDSHRPGNNKIK